MEAYTEEVERLGDRAPWQAEGVMERWQQGTAIDMTSLDIL